MATFRSRFPSGQATLLAFAICAVPIHIWAFIAIFRAIPAWILSMNFWEMLGVMAYPLVFELFESLLVLSGLLISAAILPAKLYRNWFVSQSVVIVFLVTIWAIFMQFYGQELRLWSSRGLITVFPLLVAIILFSILNVRFNGLRKKIEALADRLVVLGILYIIIDVFFLFILIYRNLL